MATQIVVLTQQTQQNYITINYLFWLSVPTAMQAYYAAQNSTIKSAWIGASTAQTTALQNGSVLEVQGTLSFSSDTSVSTMGTALVTAFNTAQTNLNSSITLQYYGSFYDSVNGWTVQDGV